MNIESVIIQCGTNNPDKDSPAEIKKGITSTAYPALKRKPCVNIIVVSGLLPRDSKGSPRSLKNFLSTLRLYCLRCCHYKP